MSHKRETILSANMDLAAIIKRIEELEPHPAISKVVTFVNSARHHLSLHCDGLWDERTHSDTSQKSKAIELLEDHILWQDRRISELLIYNNELLARARDAEGKLKELRALA